MKKLLSALLTITASSISFAGLPEMMRIYNSPELAPKVTSCHGDKYCNGFVALSKQWESIPDSYRYHGFDIKDSARKGITFDEEGRGVGLERGFYFYTDRTADLMSGFQEIMDVSNFNYEAGLAVLLYIEDKNDWVGEQFSYENNEYKKIAEGDDYGVDEYPAFFIEKHSIEKGNGTVTAILLEKYSDSSLGYKMKTQVNCTNKTAKIVNALWLGRKNANMTADFVGKVFKIEANDDGIIEMYEMYCDWFKIIWKLKYIEFCFEYFLVIWSSTLQGWN